MRIRLADQRDDPRLREMLRASPMPGWVRLACAREPDFFAALSVEGRFTQVIVAEENGRIQGMGTRGVRPVYINGSPGVTGYLGGLRIAPAVRSGLGLHRGYRFLAELHQDGRAPAYLTTIVEANVSARSLLTSGRAGLPRYRDMGRFVTQALPLRRMGKCDTGHGMTIRPCTPGDIADVVDFLNRHGRKRQFFPMLSVEDLGTPYLRGLRAEDFYAARGDGRIAGVAARWNQRGFKQHRIAGYAGPLSALRPFINPVLSLAGYPTLPPPGNALKMSYAAFPCIRDDAPETLTALLRRMTADSLKAGDDLLIVGLHEADPLRRALKPFAGFRYLSRIYLAVYDADRPFYENLDKSRIPHLETGTL